MTFRLWLATALPFIAALLLAVGGSALVADVTGLGLSAPWVHVVALVVSGAGALGALLSNPPPLVKTLVPWLFPVTVAQLKLAASPPRLVHDPEVLPGTPLPKVTITPAPSGVPPLMFPKDPPE
jgi:hypothetical protein